MKTASEPGKPDRLSKHWPVGVVILLFVLNGLWMVRMSGEVTPVRAGTSAPGFSLPLLGAGGLATNPLSLASLRGRPVVLDFWATWCGPCLEALPELGALSRQYHRRGLEVIGVATSGSTLEDTERIVSNERIPYRVVLDADGKVADRYGVQSLPTLLVLDRALVIRAIEEGGPKSRETLARLIRPYL